MPAKDAITRWEGQVKEFKMSPSYKALLGIDGEAIEFEWNILRERNIEPEKFTDRIIFMSVFNDIDWTRKGNDVICMLNSEKVKECAKRFLHGHWTFLGLGDEKKWYGTLPSTPEGKWDSTATRMVERFKDTGHPVFKSISASSRATEK